MLTRRMFVRTLCVVGAGLTTAWLAGCTTQESPSTTTEQAAADKPITLTDFLDKQIELPAVPQRLVTLVYPSFSRVLFYGEHKRVVMTARFDPTEWTKKLYPDIESIDPVVVELADARQPNVEEVAAQNPDLVYYWANESDAYQAIESLKIPIVAAYPKKTAYDTVDAWLGELNKEMHLYADSLGIDAQEKAADWSDYLNETVAELSKRMEGLPESEVKSVYYIRQDPDGLQAFAYNSYCRHVVELAGGRLVTADPQITKGFERFTLEQIIEWDPDVIVMGWLNSTEAVTQNPQWAGIKAVREGQVHLLPWSVNLSWPHDVELPLSLWHMASILHPERVKDIDLVQLTVDFHKRFRSAEITAEDAKAMLTRQNPPA